MMDAVHAGGLGGTYGGNPVACAAALGAIETMAGRGPGRPRPAGSATSCCPGCASWPTPHPVIGDVRGRGAMIAIELVKPGTLEPDAAAAGADRQGLPRRRAWSSLTCGTFGNVLRFLPPLVIGDDLLERGPVDPGGRLRRAVRTRESRPGRRCPRPQHPAVARDPPGRGQRHWVMVMFPDSSVTVITCGENALLGTVTVVLPDVALARTR